MVKIVYCLTTDLTEDEWETYLTTIELAVKTIDPTTNVSVWESGIQRHRELGDFIHGGKPMFGYAHRYFLKWFEEKLQKLNPNFAFFYWDTGKEFDKWTESKIWNYLGDKTGLVKIKAFNGTKFKSIKDAQLQRFCITAKNPPPSEYYRVLWEKTKGRGYADYCRQLELTHGVIHNLIGGKGGQMSILHYSPLDPIFYAHHANIDYTLLQAQLLWSEEEFPKERSYTPLTLNLKLPTFPDISVGDVLDVADICVSYLPSEKKEEVAVTEVTTNSTATANNTGDNTTIVVANSTITNSTVANSTVTNSTVSNSTAGGLNSTTSVIANGTDSSLKNFTLELSDEWVQMSFKNNFEEMKKEAEDIQETLKDKIDRGETIKTTVVSDDQSRAYVGVKPSGEKNLKRLDDSGAKSNNIEFAALMILFTIFC